MRLVKAALLVAIGFSVVWMWSTRDYLVDAYQTSPDAPQVRLSGVDLAVARAATTQSPFAIPVAPDSRNRPVPALAMTDSVEPAAVSITGGEAALGGTVTGPDGLPVEGATVEVQRHTSQGSASTILVTDASGHWSAEGLPGGRYRARAWVPRVLTMGGSKVVFLAEDETVDLPFSLWGIDPAPQLEFVHSGELYVGIAGTFAVVVSNQIIDDRGVVLTVPMVTAPVTIQTTQHVTVLSAPLQYTGNDGAARFSVICPEPAVDGTSNPGTNPAVDPSSNPSADPSSNPSDDAAVPSRSAGIGTVVARSGELVEGFALPPCVSPPAPEPLDPAEQTAAAQGRTDG